ncbi:hypothetical protein HPG69_005025, partial [Diceros bicornis minor]
PPPLSPASVWSSNLDATEGKFGSQDRNVYPFAGFCSLFLREGTKSLQTHRLHKHDLNVMPMPPEFQGHKVKYIICTVQGERIIAPFDKCSGKVQDDMEAYRRGIVTQEAIETRVHGDSTCLAEVGGPLDRSSLPSDAAACTTGSAQRASVEQLWSDLLRCSLGKGGPLPVPSKPMAGISNHPFIFKANQKHPFPTMLPLFSGGQVDKRETTANGSFPSAFESPTVLMKQGENKASKLSGLIRTRKNEFLISPLPQLLAQEHNYSSPAGHHPHVLYKRTAEEKVQRCHGYPGSSQNYLGHPPSHSPHTSQSQETEHHHRRLQKQHFCGRRKKYAPKPPPEDTYLRFDEYGGAGRPRRSAGKSQKGLNVETLVVADKKMVEKHSKANVTTYILTVMNMVSSLFKDGTIGSDINVVVVSLILLEQEPGGLLINHHADQSLNSFCQWQSALIGKNGKRHDHAILLTGFDICSWKNEPCDTLGFAPISGMCSKYRSCTINEDTGLGLAFTIAHESGHNFGMIHDGEGNPCRKAEGNIMSPTLTGNNGVFSWSSCSRQYLKKFLSTPQAGCLVDEPKQTGQYKYPDKLPGQIYDADTQCKWQFGAKAKLCSLGFAKDICKSLWCHRVGHRCETKFMPAAEGTVCGLSMWCRQGQCVKFGEHGPRPVHGQWSAWSKWSECSRTCGGGVTYQERHCNNPKPQYGGKFCPGSSRIYQLCNINPCDENSLDFRAQQCAEYNSKPFRGWFYQWKPYTKVEEEDRCKLYCKAENFEFFFAMSGKVKDGTPCSPHKNDVCIDGICEPVGCDLELGSKAVLDACGVCKGDNSTCKFYKGLYLNQHKANEYYPVVIIPAGARSIEIQELQISSSYLAVRSLNQKYYLTGGWSINWPGEFTFAGTVFEYQRGFNHPEHLYAPGPTNETLVFETMVSKLVTTDQIHLPDLHHVKTKWINGLISAAIFVGVVSLSNFVHKRKTIPVVFHSSVCNFRFAVKHILSAGKPQQRIRQEMMERAKQNNRENIIKFQCKIQQKGMFAKTHEDGIIAIQGVQLEMIYALEVTEEELFCWRAFLPLFLSFSFSPLFSLSPPSSSFPFLSLSFFHSSLPHSLFLHLSVSLSLSHTHTQQ